jgi:glycosyltransferase involved in cell wall biosynthesis
LIHAIILTLDEERHIGRCINSLRGQCASITVIDSGSKDGTVEIARSLGAVVLTNPWTNHATQVNFAIEALAGRGGWLLRIDADEIVDGESQQSLTTVIDTTSDNVAGLLVQRRIHFLGKRIRHGTIEPSWQLRLWRNGTGRCEQRWMDEHIKVAGEVAKTGLVLSDINLNSLSWWTAKHNCYASLEAIEQLNRRHNFMAPNCSDHGQVSLHARRRRFLKEQLYTRVPPGVRSLTYFLYRYLFRLGFLDGREGFYFHVLQGFWYRTLIDAKVADIEEHAAATGISIAEAIRERTGINAIAHTSKT